MILESGSGRNQDYACVKPQMVALGPREEKKVSIDGVCRGNSPKPAATSTRRRRLVGQYRADLIAWLE